MATGRMDVADDLGHERHLDQLPRCRLDGQPVLDIGQYDADDRAEVLARLSVDCDQTLQILWPELVFAELPAFVRSDGESGALERLCR